MGRAGRQAGSISNPSGTASAIIVVMLHLAVSDTYQLIIFIQQKAAAELGRRGLFLLIRSSTFSGAYIKH